MRISDWSSDVCSSDLGSSGRISPKPIRSTTTVRNIAGSMGRNLYDKGPKWPPQHCPRQAGPLLSARLLLCFFRFPGRRTEHEDQGRTVPHDLGQRSEEHTSELQSLMRISYAVFCLKKKTIIPIK